VTSCEKASPRRGIAAISAAKVVIMIGRKRTLAARTIASFGVEREVDHHDRVLLDDADQHDDPHEAVDIQVEPAEQERRTRATAGIPPTCRARPSFQRTMMRRDRIDRRSRSKLPVP